MPDPGIVTNPALGITESTRDGKSIVDNRTPIADLPLLHPETNIPADDAHRVNHALGKIDDEIEALVDASLLDLPYYLIRP